MKLSILICSVPERLAILNRMLNILLPQLTGDVQLLINFDTKVASIGQKRDDTLRMAQGDYVVFVDDDDEVADYYVAEILNALKTNPDCVGFKGVMTISGENPKEFLHSIKYGRWYEDNDYYYRTPNHWNPIRRELALKIGFKPINWGEDHLFSNAIFPLLKTEVYVDRIMYYYLADPKTSLANKRKREDEAPV